MKKDPSFNTQHSIAADGKALVGARFIYDMPKRYFLDQDNSSHWYMVEADRRDDWVVWVELDDEDKDGWDTPEYAFRVDGGPNEWTFQNPLDSNGVKPDFESNF